MCTLVLLGVRSVAIPALRGVIRPHSLTPHTLPDTTRRRHCLNGGRAEERSMPDINVAERTANLLAALEAKGVTKFSQGHTSALYQLLLDLGIKPKTIEAQLREMPDLLRYPLRSWSETSTAMAECGLPSLTILQNIATMPSLLQVKPKELANTMLKLHDINIAKQNVLMLASSYPTLYFYSSRIIKNRLKDLQSMFPPTDLAQLIHNSPNVLTEKWTTLMDKVMYIHKVMGLEQPHIASCSCLTRPLLHIKMRHQFLYRAGLYKTPNLLKDPYSNRHNRRLSDIIDSSDRFFANKVAHLTDVEYEVFQAMMEEEEESGIQDYPYADSDDDEDDIDGGYEGRKSQYK